MALKSKFCPVRVALEKASSSIEDNPRKSKFCPLRVALEKASSSFEDGPKKASSVL